MRLGIEGLALLLAAPVRGVEKTDAERDIVDGFDVTSGSWTMVSCAERGFGEASATSGTPSSPDTERGSPL